MPHKLYSLDETRGLLRISRSKLYGLLTAGDLRSVKIGRRRLVPEEALDAYIAHLQGVAEGGGTAA